MTAEQPVDRGNGSDAGTLRAEAEAVLKSLERDREITRQHLAELNKSDAYEAYTGRSALDKTIEETRRFLADLERADAAR